MISDERRPLRDVLRTRLRLVDRRISAMNSVHRLLEKMNVRDVVELPELMQLQARCHMDQIVLLEEQIKDLERALHPRFFSYCRLVPGADDSGGKHRHKRGSKDGNRYLKLAFSHASVRAVQYYAEIGRWYQSKKRKKPDAIARALVSKEIARIVYHVLMRQENFNGRFKGQLLSRLKNEQWPLLPSPTGITEAARSESTS